MLIVKGFDDFCKDISEIPDLGFILSIDEDDQENLEEHINKYNFAFTDAIYEEIIFEDVDTEKREDNPNEEEDEGMGINLYYNQQETYGFNSKLSLKKTQSDAFASIQPVSKKSVIHTRSIISIVEEIAMQNKDYSYIGTKHYIKQIFRINCQS